MLTKSIVKNSFYGFCMALADSVPGVSGGTVAFIMGFYDDFIGSIHSMVFGSLKEKKRAFLYLIKLGAGWVIGMALAVLLLSSLFESHIYAVSSLFIGLVAGSFPVILREEKTAVKSWRQGLPCGVAGMVIVTGITWLNGNIPAGSMDLGKPSVLLFVRLFLIGLVAISAMFLPGISGSTLLLIMGAYLPVIAAIRATLSLDLAYIPALFFFGLGILAGAATVVKGIRICLEKYRPQAIYAILGMMAGSFYAIIVGPTTLEARQAAMDLHTFQPVACLAGGLLVALMEIMKERGKKNGTRNS